MDFVMKENGEIAGDFPCGTLSISTEEERGLKPLQLFVSSIAGCSGTILAALLNKKRIPVEHLRLSAKAERERGGKAIKALKLVAVLDTTAAHSPEQLTKICELVLKNCGMIQTILPRVDVKFSIECKGVSK
ncbi:OsmC family protein [Metabacillus sp. 84]|uniref:OsmC family protein n=1 Tax=unclassified Metabacillus TaxID=2675274 RepID=UPI003CED2A13